MYSRAGVPMKLAILSSSFRFSFPPTVATSSGPPFPPAAVGRRTGPGLKSVSRGKSAQFSPLSSFFPAHLKGQGSQRAKRLGTILARSSLRHPGCSKRARSLPTFKFVYSGLGRIACCRTGSFEGNPRRPPTSPPGLNPFANELVGLLTSIEPLAAGRVRATSITPLLRLAAEQGGSKEATVFSLPQSTCNQPVGQTVPPDMVQLLAEHAGRSAMSPPDFENPGPRAARLSRRLSPRNRPSQRSPPPPCWARGGLQGGITATPARVDPCATWPGQIRGGPCLTDDPTKSAGPGFLSRRSSRGRFPPPADLETAAAV